MLLPNLDLLATAPGGVAKLRELILTLAVQGRLVPQDPADEPASVLLQKIRAEKNRLITEGKIKRDKLLPPIAGEEKPFEIPRGWEWARVGQVASRVQYGVTASADPTQIVPKFVRITDIQNDKVNWDTVPGMQGVTQDFCQHYLASGDLLIARTGGTIGKSFLVCSVPVNAVFASYLIRISPARSMNPNYLKIFAGSRHYWEQLYAKSMGTGQPNVNGTALAQLTLPLPPLAEQSRIVTCVESLMRLCDALEAKGQLEASQHAQLVGTLLDTLTASATPHELADSWQRVAQHFDLLMDRPEAIDALEQTLLQLAVRGLLVPQDPTDEPASALLERIRAEKDRLIAEGKIKCDKPLPPITDKEHSFELPVGWEWVRLGSLIELISGQHLDPGKYVEGLGANLPYLTGPAEFGLETPKPTRSTNERRAVAICNDILITVKGSGVGKLNIVSQPEIAISRQLMAARPVVVGSEFLAFLIETMTPYFQSKSIGIAIPGIGRNDVTHAVFGLPPFAEQSRIVARVTALRRMCAGLRQRLAERQSVQARLADALAEII